MTKNSCQFCGNNPVPHRLHWYFESLNILFTPLRAVFLYNPVSGLVRKFLGKLHVSLFLTRVFQAVGIISYQKDKSLCKVERAKVLWDEAEKRGIEFAELLLFGQGIDAYMAEQVTSNKLQVTRSKTIVFSGLPRPQGYDDSSLDTLDDKYALKKKFKAAGLPVPNGGSAWTFSQALKIFRTVEKPVIVKPRAGSRGRHSTTHVSTESDLKVAFRIAKKLCFWVMVEEHIEGPVYRATVIDFKLSGVLRGDSPQVVGDGKLNIAQLVEQKNLAPHEGVKDILLDAKAVMYLQRQQLTPASVPVQGRVVTLSEKIGVNYGGSSSEDMLICHPDNKELFVQAARVAGDPIVGFDYIIPDITKSFKVQKTGFIEANSLPFINLHHNPLKGTPQNVASRVWDMVGM